MTVLAKDEIIKSIQNGKIKIEPFDINNVGAGSVDLTLSNKFRIFKKSSKIIDLVDSLDYRKITKLIKAESVIIKPGEAILGITEEKICLAPNICGWLEGRSRFARIGLMVHVSASFMQPGIFNRQVLEIVNMGNTPFRIHSGTKICQFIFEETRGRAKYQGKFKDQKEP